MNIIKNKYICIIIVFKVKNEHYRKRTLLLISFINEIIRYLIYIIYL